MTEAGVKQFNKRVKGTEQFWHNHGVEPILALRSLGLSDDDRWDHYWLCQSPCDPPRRLSCTRLSVPATTRYGRFGVRRA